MEHKIYEWMYTFYKQGNSLPTMFEWTKQAYGSTYAPVLMSGFIKKYSKDKKLKDEFNRTCFIGA